MNKVLAQGAEAIISKQGSKVIKDRIPKSYRLKSLDEKIRKQRTKREAKLMTKANKLIHSPKLISQQTFKLELEYIAGKKLSEHLEKTDCKKVCKQIGFNIAKLHDAGIIHGDLTTSNLILKDDKVYFIDFGLGFHSNKVEDKAVDLHLIKQALEAKHSSIYEQAFKAVLQGYKKSENYSQVLKRLEKVESRGRYKKQQ